MVHFQPLENLCLSETAMVVGVHDVALVAEYAVSTTTRSVVVKIWWSQLWSSWHQQGLLYGSLLMTPTALHAHCAIVKPTATMCVKKQNYAGSRINSGSCWMCSSGWHTICLHYSYNSRPTFQLMQNIARFSRHWQ